jgi:phosphatidylglycerophosphatase A
MSRTSPTDRAARAVVTFLGLGRLPLAPGTWGTLGAAGLHALTAWAAGGNPHPAVCPLLAALFTLASIAWWPWASRFYGAPDPGPFVLDEAAGYFLAVSFFPGAPQPWVGLAAFVGFRFFDVVKPFPARRAERAPGGLGIVFDDLAAGLYAACFVWACLALLG